MKILIILLTFIKIIVADWSSQIVGGHEASTHEFPYQVSLQWNYNNGRVSHYCGGSILTKYWILTAAHCKINYSFNGYLEVVAGEHDLENSNDAAQRRRADEFIEHEDYRGGVGPYDIGLIKLKKPFKFNDVIQPIQLPNKNSIPDGNAIISGWGSTSTTRRPDFPDTLQKAELPIIEINECKKIWGRSPLSKKTNLCAGDLYGTPNACSGDSGGPLVQHKGGRTIQVGIVSWGRLPCGSKNRPGIFTKVSYFVDWINDKIH